MKDVKKLISLVKRIHELNELSVNSDTPDEDILAELEDIAKDAEVWIGLVDEPDPEVV